MIKFNEEITAQDRSFIERTRELALEAESKGNMPIGSIIVLNQEIIAEGQNQLLVPDYRPGAHAEMMAIQKVSSEQWQHASSMTCYSSLEPCIMCTSSLLLHGIRRVVFGALDDDGGGRYILNSLPPYYQDSTIHWVGPVDPDNCKPLYERALERFQDLPCGCP